MNTTFIAWLLLIVPLASTYTAEILPVHPFAAEDDARVLYENRNAHYITNLLTMRSSEQRVAIAQAYKKEFKKDLVKRFKKFSNNLSNLLVAMVTPLPEYYAKELSNDADFIGVESHATVDILTTSSNADIKAIDDAYTRLKPTYRLVDKLDVKFRGLPWNVVRGQFALVRNETQEVDKDLITADAKVVYEYGQQMNTVSRESWRHERPILHIFMYRSFKHLHELINEYENIYGYKMERAFKRWTASDLADGAINMINVLRSVPDYFARRLRDILVGGLYIKNRELNRIIVGRSEIDINDINDSYKKNFGIYLSAEIQQRISGEYGRLLVSIVDSKR